MLQENSDQSLRYIPSTPPKKGYIYWLRREIHLKLISVVYSTNKTNAQLAEQAGLPEKEIHSGLQELRKRGAVLDKRSGGTLRSLAKWDEKTSKIAIELYRQGYKAGTVAKETGLKTRQVSSLIERSAVTAGFFTEEQMEEIRLEHAKNKPLKNKSRNESDESFENPNAITAKKKFAAALEQYKNGDPTSKIEKDTKITYAHLFLELRKQFNEQEIELIGKTRNENIDKRREAGENFQVRKYSKQPRSKQDHGNDDIITGWIPAY